LSYAPTREKAAAGFLSLDASSGLLATASASAPAMFLALGSRRFVVSELYDMRDKKKKKKNFQRVDDRRADLSIYLSICLSNYPSIHLSIY